MTHTSNWTSTILEDATWRVDLPTLAVDISDNLAIPHDCHGGYVVFPWQVSEDVVTISGLSANKVLILHASDSGKTITIKNNSDLHLAGSDFSMNNTFDSIMLLSLGSGAFLELSRSNNAA